MNDGEYINHERENNCSRFDFTGKIVVRLLLGSDF